jgi:hypothetical protein
VAWTEEQRQEALRRRQEFEARQQAMAEQAARRDARLQQRADDRFGRDTGLGACPQCGSTNISRLETGGADGSAQAATCCCGCAFFWPLMLLAPFLFRRPKQWHARCNNCGFTRPM